MYQYNSDRHYRDTRVKGNEYQWCLYSSKSGKLLKILLRADTRSSLEAQIEGWKASEAKDKTDKLEALKVELESEVAEIREMIETLETEPAKEPKQGCSSWQSYKLFLLWLLGYSHYLIKELAA